MHCVWIQKSKASSQVLFPGLIFNKGGNINNLNTRQKVAYDID